MTVHAVAGPVRARGKRSPWQRILAVAIASLGLLLVGTSPAEGQRWVSPEELEQVRARVGALIEGAYEDYDFLDLDDAERKLGEARSLIEQYGLDPALLLEVNLLDGVLNALHGHEARAIQRFREALDVDPQAGLHPYYLNPTMEMLLGEARRLGPMRAMLAQPTVQYLQPIADLPPGWVPRDLRSLRRFETDDMPVAIASTGPDTWLFGSPDNVREVEASGRVRQRLPLRLPGNWRCRWDARDRPGLAGVCRSEIRRENEDNLFEIHAVWCESGACNSHRLHQGTDRQLRALDVYAAPTGEPVVAFLIPRDRENETPARVAVYRGSQQLFVTEPPEGGGIGRLTQAGRIGAQVAVNAQGMPVLAIRRGSTGVVMTPAGQSEPFQTSFAWDLVADPFGAAHLVFYDPRTRSLMAGRVEPERPALFTPQMLDTAESGFENSVQWIDDRLVVDYYFYRNAFYKGLRRVEVSPSGQPIAPPIDLSHSELDNVGWGIVSSSHLRAGGVMCYGVGQSAAFNLASADEARVPRGECTVVDDIRTVRADEPDHPNYRNYFFLGGIGTWYRPWFFNTLKPDAQEDLQELGEPFDLRYRAGAALQNEAILEGRVGRVRLGMAYAQSLANRIEGQFGEALPSAISRQFRGLVGVDDLIGNHDLQLQFRGSWLNLAILDDGNPANNTVASSSVNEIWISAINIYRMRYGLRYQSFDTRVPIYTYRAGPVSRNADARYRYQPGLSGPTDVQMHDITAIFGYSLLDYAGKYETRLSRLYADAVGGAGIALARIQDDGTERSDDESSPVTFAAFGESELGYMWYRRYAGAGQLGLYFKGGLRGSLQYRGSAKRPSDREARGDDSDQEPRTIRTFSLIDYRAGPFIQIGAVF